MITAQNADTGYFGGSMYHHGFAMLGLAEAYGAVDEAEPLARPQRSCTIGQAPGTGRPGRR